MKFLAILLINLYKIFISPIFALIGVRCRFNQSCSTSAKIAFEKYPPIKAFKLTFIRLINCQPFSKKPPTDSL